MASESPGPDGEKYTCSECGDAFETHNQLGGHVNQCKKDSKDDIEVDCPSCDRTFKNRQALGTHHGRTHGESLKAYERRTGAKGDTFACPACDGLFKSRTAIGVHYAKSHDDPEPLKQLMIDELVAFSEEIGRVPKTKDLSSPETDIWTQKSYHDRFGSLQEALKQAGLDERGRYRNIPREDLCEELRRVYDVLGHAPYTTEMKTVAKYSYNAYLSEFKTWAAACEAADVPAPDVYGSNNPLWNGGKSISDAVRKNIGSESWEATAKRIRHRDGHECQQCGVQLPDRKLDVHHVVPIMAGGCNEDELLITVCGSCHRLMESHARELFDTVLVD